MRWLLELIFGRIAKMLEGYRTIIGAFGLIFLGLSGIIGTYFPDSHLPPMDIDKALAYISLGVGGFGIGQKIEKNTRITRETQEKILSTTPPS